jgi:hypothetical protein
MKESAKARGSVRFEEIRARPARGPFAASRGRPQPVHKNEPRPTPGLLRINYLAFALAAAAAVAEGSAKAITASPSIPGASTGLPPKP